MDEGTYPGGPDRVPRELTRPTQAYRRHAYLAVAGLLLFVSLYFTLTGWFAWTSYHLIAVGLRVRGYWPLVIPAAGVGFLAVFMAKALIFVRRGKPDGNLELTAAEHPRLFVFLYRLADEAHAPRPHRVFAASGVNAAVYYDFSLVNLIVPSRKNLQIGLGLVNVLTLGELKAVLAHQFGHFAQQTMAIGRWIYMAQQIAGHIVVKRDALDRCTARRMADTAAHLVENVLPHAPYRQWVFTAPKALRLRLARDPAWTTWVGNLAVRAIGAWQRRIARRRGIRAPRTGAITFVQRFGGLVNLNVHFHLLVPDGVFVDDEDQLALALHPVPTSPDVLAILDRIMRRIARRLAGEACDDGMEEGGDVFAQARPRRRRRGARPRTSTSPQWF